jgi:hypothetical protein
MQGAHQSRIPDRRAARGRGRFYCAYHFGFGLKALAAAVFFWCVIALALIDQKTGYLPDDITLPLMWLGLLVNLAGTFVPLADAVIGAVAGYMVLWTVNAIFRALRGVGGNGIRRFQDDRRGRRFPRLARALHGDPACPSFVGLVFGTAQMFAARRGWDWKFKFHFGPYIAIAGVIALFWATRSRAAFPCCGPLGMSFVVGLTGGIGSGKSAAAAEFERLGASVVDTDAIAHALTAAGGAAMGEIRKRFGAEILAASAPWTATRCAPACSPTRRRKRRSRRCCIR